MIHVVVGPPCGGKSTLVQESRSDGDVVVDYDLIARALGAGGHRPDGDIKEVAHVARKAVIDFVLAGIGADSWIIHTSPSADQMKAYLDAGAEFELVDPGIDECLSRVDADNRPDGTADSIRDWYESPPNLTPISEPPKPGGFFYARRRATLKIKLAPIQVKAGVDGQEEGVFEAYASTFTREPDSYGDVVAKGAFAKTLTEWADSGNVLPVLWGHNLSDPDYNIGSVVSAVEDDHGLRVTGKLDLDNPKATQVYRLLKGKRVSQMSFAFDVLDEGRVEEGGVKLNELRDLKLYEVSIVPVGANQDTEILAVKAAVDALADGVKSGRVLSAKNESAIAEVVADITGASKRLTDILTAVRGEEDQAKASGQGQANDEEPESVKSEELPVNPSASALMLEVKLYSPNGEEGVQE